jgi:hypothetical protein
VQAIESLTLSGLQPAAFIPGLEARSRLFNQISRFAGQMVEI